MPPPVKPFDITQESNMPSTLSFNSAGHSAGAGNPRTLFSGCEIARFSNPVVRAEKRARWLAGAQRTQPPDEKSSTPPRPSGARGTVDSIVLPIGRTSAARQNFNKIAHL